MDNYINSIKKTLETYAKDTKNNIELIYSKARQTYDESYKTALDSLRDQYKADTNSTYSKKSQDERNTAELLNSRGLSRSGEMVSNKIAADIALGNTLNSLSVKNSENIAALSDGYAKNIASLSSDKAKNLSELDKWSISLASQIADSEAADKLARDKFNHDVEIDKNQAELKAKELSILESEANKTKNNSTETNTTGSVKKPDETEKNLFTPSVSPKELAKTTVARLNNGHDYVSSQSAKISINEYLKSLIANGIDNQYLDELVFNLESLGYSEPADRVIAAKKLATDSYYNYKRLVNEYYKIFNSRSGVSTPEAIKMAEEKAKRIQYEYLYKHSENKNDFESAVGFAGLYDGIRDFYAFVEKSNTSADMPDIHFGAWNK